MLSHILGKAHESSALASHRLRHNVPDIQIIFQLSNVHAKSDSGQVPALKSRLRNIIINRSEIACVCLGYVHSVSGLNAAVYVEY
jgi:hypothetical protein